MTDDERLRAAGFAIKSRPRKGEALWRHVTGIVYAESVALEILDDDDVDAKRLQHEARKRNRPGK